jgi:type IV secretory pathway TrbL component
MRATNIRASNRVIPLPVILVNDKNRTKIVNTGVMKTRPSQQNKTNILPLNQFFRNVLNKNALRMLFSLGLPSFVIVMLYYLVIFLSMQKLPLLRA